MDNQFIHEVDHQPLKPVSVERDGDTLIIEGVRYAGDFFRVSAGPNEDVLYSIYKDSDDVTCVRVIRDANEAVHFFDVFFFD